MKKFALISIILIIFIACAVFGFTGAKTTWQVFETDPASPQPAATAAPISNGIQHNILIIQVDDLQSPQPRLESAWISFFSFTEPPVLTLKIVHPSPQPGINPSTFGLDSQGFLTSNFLSEINKYNFPYEGYLVLDRYGMKTVGEWLGGQTVDIPAADAGQDPFMIYMTGTRTYNNICAGLPTYNQREFPISWRQLVPTHLRTNLSFETMILYWDYLTKSQQAPYCEIIPWG